MRTNSAAGSLWEVFPSGELRDELSELVDTTEELRGRQPVTGFEPKHFIPGWIGMVQSYFVERKMERFNDTDFILGKGYWSFGTWLLNKACAVSGAASRQEDTGDKLTQEQCESIVMMFDSAVAAWVDCCPEMAGWRYIGRDYCELQRVQYTLADILKSFGYPQVEDDGGENQGCMESLKEQGLYIGGILMNLLIIAVIAGILQIISLIVK